MRLINREDLNTLSEQVVESYPCNMISEIMDMQDEIKDESKYLLLDSVIDIIVDNTIWE